MNSCVNTTLCMIMGDGTNKYVSTGFSILNEILFKSNQNFLIIIHCFLLPVCLLGDLNIVIDFVLLFRLPPGGRSRHLSVFSAFCCACIASRWQQEWRTSWIRENTSMMRYEDGL